MAYELWISNNLIGEFPNEAEALAIVRQSVDAHGPDSVKQWVLLYEDDEDETKGRGVAAGESLVALAQHLRGGPSQQARTA